jgi:uncharacterized metal-binding protein
MSISPDYQNLPLVYSCSGCSSAAQAANYIAVELDRNGEAEMSCISGVGGNVKSLVKKAKAGRPVIALDGCALACTKQSLAQHGVVPDYHLQLQEHGMKKRYHADFDQTHADQIMIDVSQKAKALHQNRTESKRKSAAKSEKTHR